MSDSTAHFCEIPPEFSSSCDSPTPSPQRFTWKTSIASMLALILTGSVLVNLYPAGWQTHVPPPPPSFEAFLDPIAPPAPMKLASMQMSPLGPSEMQTLDEEWCDGDVHDCWGGDILMNAHQKETHSAAKNLSARGFVKEAAQLMKQMLTFWPNGVVMYSFDPAIHPESKKAALEAMVEWSGKTCIRFQEVRGQKTLGILWIQSSPDGQGGCYGSLGYSTTYERVMNLEAPGCAHFGVALHELGHVIGMSHEHERPSAPQYVQVEYNNADEWWKQWLGPTGRDIDMSAGVPYDLGSIMHYGPFAGSLSYGKLRTLSVIKKDSWGNCKIGQRMTLSEGDITTVNRWYGCPDRFCADFNQNCGDWRSQGFCSTTSEYYAFMKGNCPNTCDLCHCNDENEVCPNWANAGYCSHDSQHLPYMSANCRRSCGFCSFEGARGCKDGNDCSRPYVWQDNAWQPSCSVRWFREQCPRTCGACEGTPFCW